MSLRYAHFMDEAFLLQKVKLLVLGLLSSRAWLSGFSDYQMSDQRNFVIIIFKYLITFTRKLKWSKAVGQRLSKTIYKV